VRTVTDRSGKVWTYEETGWFGPIVLTKSGEVSRRQPGPDSPFWDAYYGRCGMEKCDLCGTVLYPELRHARDGVACAMFRAAYVRGLREGVEVARERAEPRLVHEFYPKARIDWTDVDREIERRAQ
jgi:hypothetical protein